MVISLITKGMICVRDIFIVRHIVYPIDLQIKTQESLNLQIISSPEDKINLSNILDKNINLKITEENINIKKSDSTDININL